MLLLAGIFIPQERTRSNLKLMALFSFHKIPFQNYNENADKLSVLSQQHKLFYEKIRYLQIVVKLPVPAVTNKIKLRAM